MTGIDNAPQRSAAWFAAREGRITGSRAGAVLGLSPFAKPDDVMVEMLYGSKFEGNPATQYGAVMEELATDDLEDELGVLVAETGLHVHQEFDWLAASPDGFIGDQTVVEIKCPYGKRNDKEPEFKALIDQPHYYAQVQLEMFCTGRTKAVFYQWNMFASELEHVDFDPEWIRENIPKLKAFHDEYLRRKELINKDFDKLGERFKEISALMAELKEEQDEIKNALIEAASGEKDIVGGVKVQKVERKGAIDYKKVPELDGVDLEPYRKKSSTFWKVG